MATDQLVTIHTAVGTPTSEDGEDGSGTRDAARRKHKHFCPGSHRLMEGTHRLVGIEIYTINPRNDHICRTPNSGMMAARQLSEAIESHHVEA